MSSAALSVDERFMREAIALAERGRRTVSPNPLVGALLVRNGIIIGQGWHERAGESHAEVRAIADALQNGHTDLSGATCYVTLEPCCHQGRTPPCTEALIRHRIDRVVFGLTDPNPLVSGKGEKTLRDAGIEVSGGVLQHECCEQNRIFITFMEKKRPWVTLKAALSLDGKTAAATGLSRWISGAEARAEVQELRRNHRAILVGAGTIFADDPVLLPRPSDSPHASASPHAAERPPLRVVLDSAFRTPPDSRLLKSADLGPILIAGCAPDTVTDETRPGAPAVPPGDTSDIPARIAALEAAGARTLQLPAMHGRCDPDALLAALAAEGIDSVLCEGGATLSASLVQAGLVDRLHLYLAPVLIGGAHAPGLLAGIGFPDPQTARSACPVGPLRYRSCGADIAIEADLAWRSPCLPV